MDISLIFPNQIFKESDLLNKSKKIYLIEEYLFFKQYKFHKQKILFHRMTMKSYESYLTGKSFEIEYINSTDTKSEIKTFIKSLGEDIKKIKIYDPVDNWLLKKIKEACNLKNIEIVLSNSILRILLNLFSRLV